MIASYLQVAETFVKDPVGAEVYEFVIFPRDYLPSSKLSCCKWQSVNSAALLEGQIKFHYFGPDASTKYLLASLGDLTCVTTTD